ASGWLIILAVLCLGWWGWSALTEIGNIRERPAPAKKTVKAPRALAQIDAAETQEPDTPILNLRSSRIRENSEVGDVARILTNSAKKNPSPPLFPRRTQP